MRDGRRPRLLELRWRVVMAGEGREKQEYELKARVPDRTALMERLEEEGWRREFRGEMLDRRYDTPNGDLEGRDEVLRVRRYRSESGEETAVLAWKGPASTEAGFKRRAEVETEVRDPEAVITLLARLGYTEVTTAIDRRIEIFTRGGVTLRLERYPRMDTLAEIEGEPREVEERLKSLGLPLDAWKPWPLPRFVERFEQRTGDSARLAREEIRG